MSFPSCPRPTLLRLALTILAILALPGAPLEAQEPGPACTTDMHRAFDFWIGSWEVRAPDDRVTGHNTIRRKMDGCVLHEHYTTPGGYEGESLNMYDASRGVWHQTWTDNGGLLLSLEGGLQDDAMVMQGETVREDGSVSIQRISWSLVDGDPDRVRQHWEQSTDGGESWATAFDGLYLRRDARPGRE